MKEDMKLLLQVYTNKNKLDIIIDGDNAEIIESVAIIFNKMIESNPEIINRESIFKLLNELMEGTDE